MAVRMPFAAFLLGCILRSGFAQEFEIFEPSQENLQLSPVRGAASADFNGDGKLDIAIVNGTSQMRVHFQDPQDRSKWNEGPGVAFDALPFFSISADFDLDGDSDDLIVGDAVTGLYLLLGSGDGSFRGDGLRIGSPCRGVTAGDWNGDGLLDLASANHVAITVGVLLGQGLGEFQSLPPIQSVGEPQSIESLDFDADGSLDLVVGIYDFGIVPTKGQGSGMFAPLKPIVDVDTVRCSRFIMTGDIDGDGRGDVIADECGVRRSQGNGTFQNAGTPGIRPMALADLNNDGRLDLAGLQGWGTALNWLVALYGMDASQFHAPVVLTTGRFDIDGSMNFVRLLARDFDRDGDMDLLALTNGGQNNPVFWGTPAGEFATGGFSLALPMIKALTVKDMNQDRFPDLFVLSGAQGTVNVYLSNGGAIPASPSVIIKTRDSLSALEVVDIDGDSVPDLAGTSISLGSLILALLNADGTIRVKTALKAGSQPSRARAGHLDAGNGFDLVVPCAGSNHLAIFSNPGNGNAAPAGILPTIQRPKDVAIEDLDGDGHTDLVALSTEEFAIHYGSIGGFVAEPQSLMRDEMRRISDPAIADLDRDGLLDLLVHQARGGSQVLVFRGRGNRQFEPMPPISAGELLDHFVLTDVNGDGLLDLSFFSGSNGMVSLLLNQGVNGFAEPQRFTFGLPLLGHAFADINADGRSDLLVHHSEGVFVLFGRPAAPPKPFIRGDASLDGHLEVNDPIVTLGRLFLGGDPLLCEDAADANDDGAVDVSDPVAVLRRLFLGGEVLPPPGPEQCGEDPTAGDALAACAAGC